MSTMEERNTKRDSKKAPPSHPPISVMVEIAIEHQKQRYGSSLYAIKKYISNTYKLDMDQHLSYHIRRALKNGVAQGKLLRVSGQGANGSFKLNINASSFKEEAKKKAKKGKEAAEREKAKQAAEREKAEKARQAAERERSAAEARAQKKKKDAAEEATRAKFRLQISGCSTTGFSPSKQQREQGNMFFQKSAGADLGTTIRISRLENALACYKNALSCSGNGDEEVSAAKNVAMASWKLAATYVDIDSPLDSELIKDYFKEALRHLSMAYCKRFWKSLVWAYQLEESWGRCLKECTEWLAEMDIQERIAGFSEILGCLADCQLKASGYIQYATLVFQTGLTAWQAGEFKDCYRYMRECYFPIQEAERLRDGDFQIKMEAKVLTEDVYLHTCVAESSMARASGDSLLESELNDQETLNMDQLWPVIDLYKQAATLCRDKDLEQEAIAYSRLGKVYGKVIMMPSRGKDYYKQAIQLALSMTPRSFHGVDWYTESTTFVEEFQKKLNKTEEDDKEKKAALAEMEDEVERLVKIDLRTRNHSDFVQKVYKTWPPKLPGAKFEEGLSDKKLLVKTISHYHPDKVDKDVHGKNWYYFSEEITKCLNRRYSRIKCPDPDDD